MGQRHPLRPVRPRSRLGPLPYVVFQHECGRYPWMVDHYPVSVRRACGYGLFSRAAWYRKSWAPDQAALRRRIREIAHSRPRVGYLRIHVMLRREGWRINRKRVHRLYRLEGLQLRMRIRRLSDSHTQLLTIAPLMCLISRNEWSPNGGNANGPGSNLEGGPLDGEAYGPPPYTYTNAGTVVSIPSHDRWHPFYRRSEEYCSGNHAQK